MTVLSFGGGQDSTAILHRLLLDTDAFKQYVPDGKLIVIMSDTGDEHPETYAHVTAMNSLCEMYSVPFFLIHKNWGHHPKTWPSLREWMENNSGIMSKAYPKSCTDNLKIKPIYNFLNAYVNTQLGGPPLQNIERKRALYTYAAKYGKIRVLLGIAKGEESRIGGVPSVKWQRETTEKLYPLIDWGWDRQACQEYITSIGEAVPPPSNCMLCPFMNDIELLWLFRFYPVEFNYWVEREQAKIAKWKALHIDPKKNFGVNGVKLLPQKLVEVTNKYGHMTNEELQEYKMSHGHCVKSKY